MLLCNGRIQLQHFLLEVSDFALPPAFLVFSCLLDSLCKFLLIVCSLKIRSVRSSCKNHLTVVQSVSSSRLLRLSNQAVKFVVEQLAKHLQTKDIFLFRKRAGQSLLVVFLADVLLYLGPGCVALLESLVPRLNLLVDLHPSLPSVVLGQAVRVDVPTHLESSLH